jgi:hypothetical protein
VFEIGAKGCPHLYYQGAEEYGNQIRFEMWSFQYQPVFSAGTSCVFIFFS